MNKDERFHFKIFKSILWFIFISFLICILTIFSMEALMFIIDKQVATDSDTLLHINERSINKIIKSSSNPIKKTIDGTSMNLYLSINSKDNEFINLRYSLEDNHKNNPLVEVHLKDIDMSFHSNRIFETMLHKHLEQTNPKQKKE